MVRPLPAIVSAINSSTPVGHYTAAGSHDVVQDWEYHALLMSEPHYRLPGGSWSGGGPFWAEHAELRHHGELKVQQWKYVDELGPTRGKGVSRLAFDRLPIYGQPKAGLVGKTRTDARVELAGLQGANYTKGILRTRPGQSEASLGQFLAELKDLPTVPGRGLLKALQGVPLKKIVPAIRARAASFLGASASEHLNYEFGWRPFLKDLRDFRALSKRIDTSLQRLIRENHRNIRRRASLGRDRVTVQDYNTPNAYNFPLWDCGGFDAMAATSGHTYISGYTTTETRTWFVAGYRYDIPDTNSWLWRGRAAAVLYGAFPTPELVYSVTPWSWLADWFTDLGDLVGYFSPNAVDALVTRYAFTMREVIRTDECTANTRWEKRSDPLFTWQDARGILTSKRKLISRQRAHGYAPFGTNLVSGTLSARQAAILASIGISRSTPR
jgi:hypothetical protein